LYIYIQNIKKMSEMSDTKGSLAQSLLQVNNLTYKLPPSLSIATKRMLRNDFFQQSSYSSGGEIMVLDCQSGNMFVDPHRSLLRFDVKAVGAGATFGSGSGANLFSRIIVRTRSGAEITRLETANLITKFKNRYEKTNDWVISLGEAQGYAENVLATGQGTTCAIRLSDLVPCFDPEGHVLLPPQMMQGLRIEIETNSAASAFVGAGATSFEINNPRIQFCNVQLGDAFARRIAEVSATQGLSVIHREIFHTQVSSSAAGQTAYNFDIKKACSKAFQELEQSPDVEALRIAGTASAVEYANESGLLPHKNYKYGTFANASNISDKGQSKHLWLGSSACMGCPIRCSKIGAVRTGKFKGFVTDIIEYESAALLGSNLDIHDIRAVAHLTKLCDLYGMDSMSAGNLIGFAMEAGEKGLLTLDKGIDLIFGSVESAEFLIHSIALKKNDIGKLL
jgi:hypothetical protein